MENKKTKRFYKVEEQVWVVSKKQVGRIESINKDTLEVTVAVGEDRLVLKMWEIDKLKYKAKAEVKKKSKPKAKKVKTTYLASVEGGVIPTKEEENGGRDCYARLEPVEREGKEVFEMLLPQLKVSKIPLGFASYLDKQDILSLKHERSSIGSVGLINVSGLIDSTYQGEVLLQVVPLVCDVLITSEVEEKEFHEETNTYLIPYKKAIAQAVILKQSEAKDVHISYEDLLKKPSTRGTGGWGSTGK
jgi:dUTPase